MTDGEYIDARELHPLYYRWDCDHCGHPWVKARHEDAENARCQACGYSQSREFKRDVMDYERTCTGCGAPVEDEPYEFWLFRTCQDCAEAEAENHV